MDNKTSIDISLNARLGIAGGFIFGAVIAFLGVLLDRSPHNIIACTAVESLFSPDLILFTASIACIIQLSFIMTNGNSKAAYFFHLKSSELTAAFTGGAFTLLIYYYFVEFGFSYHPILFKIPYVFFIIFLLLGFMTVLPLLSYLYLKIDRRNINKGLNPYVVAYLVSFSIVSMGFIIFSSEPIGVLSICTATEEFST